MTSGPDSRGFTLLEVIFTIILSALAGLASFTFLHGVVTRSAEPVSMVQDLAGARTTMEAAAAQYQLYLQGEITWNQFRSSFVVSDVTAQMGNPPFQILAFTVSAANEAQTIVAYFPQ